MSVQMRRSYACAKYLCDLRSKFDFNITKAYAASQQPIQELRSRREKPAVRVNQGGNLRWRRDWNTLREAQVYSNTHLGRALGHGGRVLERVPIRHQAGAGHNAFAMRIDNRLVDQPRQSKIVSIDNQVFHRLHVNLPNAV
jgi:hypothetical protein